jgi:prophage regulatory protein
MKLLSFDDLRTVKGIRYSRPHLYRLISAKRFPRPVKLGENCVAFPEHEIDAWLKDKIAERDAKLEVA